MKTQTRMPSDTARMLVERLRGVERGTEAIKTELVNLMRDDGYTWKDVGDVFGITRQAANARWGNRD